MGRVDIQIIGGGASGLVCAITAAQEGRSVRLFEKGERVGRKLQATGNGRCNISHHRFTTKNYVAKPQHFIEPALNLYDEESTLRFFESLGVTWMLDERERYYPSSLVATSVVDALRLKAQELGVDIKLGTSIKQLSKKEDYYLCNKDKNLASLAVVVATGGEAAPQLGGSALGYGLLKQLGHQLEPRHPGVVQLRLKGDFMPALKGIHWDISLSFLNKVHQGELLFTDYGLSGPVALACSSQIQRRLIAGKKVALTIDLCQHQKYDELVDELVLRCRHLAQRQLSDYFIGRLPRALAMQVFRTAQIKGLGRQVANLSQQDVLALANALKKWKVEVVGTQGFKDAQVTLGGASCQDFHAENLESKRSSGLFACGEVLDVDGDCGGYNLQWAWSSGRLAGRSACQYITNKVRRTIK